MVSVQPLKITAYHLLLGRANLGIEMKTPSPNNNYQKS